MLVTPAGFFGGPTEETAPAGGFVTFPLTLVDRAAVVDAAGIVVDAAEMSPAREAVCKGYRVTGMREKEWDQMLYEDREGREWGGNDPGNRPGPLADILQ